MHLTDLHCFIITDYVVLWKIKKFDWLMPETNFLQGDMDVCMCLHFAMRLLSVAAGLPIAAY